jgi:sigma-E factor negative regulatory protein RseA
MKDHSAMDEHERSDGPATPGLHDSTHDPALSASQYPDHRLYALSALYDGQADAAEQELALKSCHFDPRVMRAWQDWHLIGDVMRSEELASSRGRDDAFLERFRVELAREPVVLAPSAAAPAESLSPAVVRSRLRRVGQLRTAMAAAAGFMAVALVVWFTQGDARGPSEGWQATLATLGKTVGLGTADEPSWQAVDGRLIRDAQLDSYLRAHRAGAPALPGGVTGRFETVVLEP